VTKEKKKFFKRKYAKIEPIVNENRVSVKKIKYTNV
jgi:hypothetical protein